MTDVSNEPVTNEMPDELFDRAICGIYASVSILNEDLINGNKAGVHDAFVEINASVRLISMMFDKPEDLVYGYVFALFYDMARDSGFPVHESFPLNDSYEGLNIIATEDVNGFEDGLDSFESFLDTEPPENGTELGVMENDLVIIVPCDMTCKEKEDGSYSIEFATYEDLDKFIDYAILYSET